MSITFVIVRCMENGKISDAKVSNRLVVSSLWTRKVRSKRGKKYFLSEVISI